MRIKLVTAFALVALASGGARAQTDTSDATRVQALVDSGYAVLIELDGALAPLDSDGVTVETETGSGSSDTIDPLLDEMDDAAADDAAAEALSASLEALGDDTDVVVGEDDGAIEIDVTSAGDEAEALPEPPTEAEVEMEMAAVDAGVTDDAEAAVTSEPDLIFPLDNTSVELGDPASIGPYRLWLASFRSKSEAQEGWEQLLKDNPGVLGSLVPVLVLKDLGADQGTFFRLQAGPLQTEADALAACDGLAESHLYCTVLGPD